jgi:hypothetical protein
MAASHGGFSFWLRQQTSSLQLCQPEPSMPKISRTTISQASAAAGDLPSHFLCAHERNASKLGQRAHGNISYQVLIYPDRKQVFLRIVANAGSGSFSDEPVPVNKLQQYISHRDMAKPIRASTIQPAIAGKSSCNAGFIAAALVAEGLLTRDPSKRHDLLDADVWESWSGEQLTTEGNLPEVQVAVSASAQSSEPASNADEGASTTVAEEDSTATAEPDAGRPRRKAKGKREA